MSNGDYDKSQSMCEGQRCWQLMVKIFFELGHRRLRYIGKGSRCETTTMATLLRAGVRVS